MPGRGLISVDKSRPLLTNSGHRKLMLDPRSGDQPPGQKPAHLDCRPDATLLPGMSGLGYNYPTERDRWMPSMSA